MLNKDKIQKGRVQDLESKIKNRIESIKAQCNYILKKYKDNKTLPQQFSTSINYIKENMRDIEDLKEKLSHNKII